MDPTGQVGQQPGVDGPQLLVRLPDGQELRAMLLLRRRAVQGDWWYRVVVPLWGVAQLADGRPVPEAVPVECWVPAAACAPLEGQDYNEIPTELPGRAPAWLVEELVDEAWLVVHRGDCASVTGIVRPATAAEARRAVGCGAALCEVCRPPVGDVVPCG